MYQNELIEEVRRNREQVLIDAGGFEEWCKKSRANEVNLKKDGWQFITLEEVLALKNKIIEHNHSTKETQCPNALPSPS